MKKAMSSSDKEDRREAHTNSHYHTRRKSRQERKKDRGGRDQWKIVKGSYTERKKKGRE